MNLVVAYDVNTETREGKRRLRQVAKVCQGFGQRVQYSVFECSLVPAQLTRFRAKLLKIVDTSQDSLRIYRLHGERDEVVEVHGRDLYTDLGETWVV